MKPEQSKQPNKQTHKQTHAHARARTHTHTHTHTILKQNHILKYQTTNCLAMSSKPTNATFWCDMTKNSPLCGIKLDIINSWLLHYVYFWLYATVLYEHIASTFPEP
jgi:uncharacterized protein YllA (UPF0747 family)